MAKARQKPSPPRIQDDRKLSLARIEQKAGKTIVEQLLAVQNYLNPKLRSFEWAHHLTCLRAAPTSKRSLTYRAKLVLEEVSVDIFQGTFRYAAVSYCCRPTKDEDEERRRYQIRNRDSHTPRPQRVRDTVLDRAAAFVSDHRLDGFWIDEECLDKHDEEKKQEAIHGMDVIYRKCDQAVGLLSKAIKSRQQLDLLSVLLRKKLLESPSKSGTVRIAQGVTLQQLQMLTKVLELIFPDRWWSRCWIFQEAYFGRQMSLLIPCTVPVSRTLTSPYIRRLGTDAELSLRRLQTQKTLICLAIRQAASASVRSLRPQAHNLLKRARRYDILHKYRGRVQEKLHHVPMSASIIADVCARGLKHKVDVPAVIANCCDYTRRIDLRSDVDKFSLSVVVLALFLLNGDMLISPAKSRIGLSRTVCELLTRSSFSQSIMPTTKKELTFLKRRRWPEVEMIPQGLKTRGHIWTLDRLLLLNASRLVVISTGEMAHRPSNPSNEHD